MKVFPNRKNGGGEDTFYIGFPVSRLIPRPVKTPSAHLHPLNVHVADADMSEKPDGQDGAKCMSEPVGNDRWS